jgi:hypothetical protein
MPISFWLLSSQILKKFEKFTAKGTIFSWINKLAAENHSAIPFLWKAYFFFVWKLVVFVKSFKE